MLESKGDIVVIADTRTAKGTAAVFGSPDMPAAALYAPIDFMKKNPNTVQALTNAMVRALIWLQKATPDQIAVDRAARVSAGQQGRLSGELRQGQGRVLARRPVQRGRRAKTR